jgi:hypothetical protein
MAFPIIPVLGAVGSIAGRLFGSGGGGLPKSIENMLMEIIRGQRMNVTLPDKGTYQAATQAQINEILAQMPVGQEGFNADLASRGLFSGGEAPKGMYQNVYAPIARAAATVGTQGMLGYEQMKMNAQQMQQQQMMQALQMLVSGQAGSSTGTQRLFDLLGEGGDFATKFMLLQKLGLIGGADATAGA